MLLEKYNTNRLFRMLLRAFLWGLLPSQYSKAKLRAAFSAKSTLKIALAKMHNALPLPFKKAVSTKISALGNHVL